ncbi:MAG: gliding motility-associated C-terminal domain-containing protein [Lewinellaceae bacterium]|nr:gliding motility-associated C-terminal domain-containing protein [Lewinellaceae bacterium]
MVFLTPFIPTTLKKESVWIETYDYAGSIDNLKITTLQPLSLDNSPNWTATICNENDFLVVNAPTLNVLGSPSIALNNTVEILDPPSNPILPVLPVDSLNQMVQLPALSPGQCHTLSLTGVYSECQAGTLTLQPGAQCIGVEPCRSSSTVELIAAPREGSAQLTVETVTPGAIPLCEPVDFTMTVLNVKTGTLFQPAVILRLLPFGQNLVPGSCRIEYKGQFVALPDPIPTPEGLRWAIDLAAPPFNLNGLPGATEPANNTFFIHFKLITDCDYIDGLRFTYRASWENQCGDIRRSPVFFGPGTQILGAPNETNHYDLGLQAAFPAPACGEQELRVAIHNPGNLGPTNGTEKIRLILPFQLEYLSGSYEPVLNAPQAQPTLLPVDTVILLHWDMPLGIQAGDSIVFRLKIRNKTPFAGCMQYHTMEVQTLTRRAVSCSTAPGGNCGIDFVMVRKSFLLGFEKPALEFSSATVSATPAPPGAESWELVFDLHNISPAVSAAGALQAEIRLDVNQNSQLDPADSAHHQFFIPLDNLPPGFTSSHTVSVSVPAANTCSGVWLLLTDTSCACTGDTLYLGNPILQNAGADSAICHGQTIQLGFPAINGYQYTWSSATAILDNPASANPIYLGDSLSQTSILILQTTRSGGCVSWDTVLVFNSKIELAAVPKPVLCFGEMNGSVSLSVSGAQAPVHYTWAGFSQTDSLLAGLPVGIYAATVTDAQGCTGTATAVVEQPPLLETGVVSTDFNGFGVSCYGAMNGTATAQASGGTPGYAFSWSTGAAGNAVSNLGAGAYSFTVTDQNGCTAQQNLTLAQPPALQLNATVKDNHCPDGKNGQIRIELSGGTPAYTVNNKPAAGAAWTWDSLAAGNYILTVADANGCTLDTSVSIQHLYSTIGVTTDSVLCQGQGNGSASIVTGGQAPFSYLWESGSMDSSISGPAGSYAFTVTDALNCAYLDTAIIGEPAALAGQLLPGHLACKGDSSGSIMALIQGGTAPVQAFLNGNPVSAVLTGLTAGTYTLTFIDLNNCPLNLTTVVEEPALLQSMPSSTGTNCHGGADGTASVSTAGGTVPYQVIWQDGVSGSERLGLHGGMYAYTVTDAQGCTVSGEVEVVEPDAYTLQLTTTKACFNQENASLTVQNPAPGMFLYGVDEPPYSPDLSFDQLGGGDHILFLSDSAGCLFEFPFNVEAYPQVLGTAELDQTITLGDSAIIYIQPAAGVPPDAIMVQWISPGPDILACPTCLSTAVWPLKTTVFQALLSTKEGCISQDPVRIQVQRGAIYIPNAIYPDDPAHPDDCCFTLYADKGNVHQIEYMAIFDRWGNQVFEQKNFEPGDPSFGWNGSYRGDKVNPAVFVWHATVIYTDGEVELFKGDVTVVR